MLAFFSISSLVFVSNDFNILAVCVAIDAVLDPADSSNCFFKKVFRLDRVFLVTTELSLTAFGVEVNMKG